MSRIMRSRMAQETPAGIQLRVYGVQQTAFFHETCREVQISAYTVTHLYPYFTLGLMKLYGLCAPGRHRIPLRESCCECTVRREPCFFMRPVAKYRFLCTQLHTCIRTSHQASWNFQDYAHLDATGDPYGNPAASAPCAANSTFS